MQIQSVPIHARTKPWLLFALNLVTLLMQIQYALADAYINERCYLL